MFDGRGHECAVRVLGVESGTVAIEAAEPRPSPREPAVHLLLAFAPPKGARGEWLFEHGTEVGVSVFQPLRCARSEPAGLGAARQERWQRLAQAAAGQCDRAKVPEIRTPRPLDAWLEQDQLPAERYVASQSGPPLGPATGPEVVLAVGPPGGWTEAELAQLAAEGFATRALGPLTLRSETAALVGAARLLQ